MNPFKFFARLQPAAALTDPQVIDETYKRSRRRAMLVITLSYAFMYTTRLPLSVVKKPLMDAGIFSAQDLGLIGLALLWGYGLGKVFNGLLVDHANLKRFYATGILVSALINLAMGSSTWLMIWTILWFFNGWFQGFGAPTGGVVLSNWFASKERGTFYGIWSAAHSIGEALTFIGTAALVSGFGWRLGFWGPGAVCVIVAIVTFFYMIDRPTTQGLPPISKWKNEDDSQEETDHKKDDTIGQLQLAILKSPIIWVLGLSSATMYITRYAINSWGVLYLQEAKGYSLIEAGSMIGLNTIAGIGGSIVYGLMSDRLFSGRRPPANLIFALFEIGALLVIFSPLGNNPVILGAAFIVYGFTLSGILASLGGLFAIDLMPRKVAGATMGIIGGFSYLAAGIQDMISGHLIEKSARVVDGVKQYDFSVPIVFWVAASIVSMLLAASLWKIKVRD